jgi:aerobic carbon-monoxide dehydrogenase medium subunit
VIDLKPPAFAYHAPTTVSEAVGVLGGVGADGKVLAGGQSLIPILNMRLASPAHLVDINGIDELDFIEVGPEAVRIGARVRQVSVEGDDRVHAACPLLRQALRLVAHPVIRNRGTVCGSLAHADPSGEMTAVLTLLGGTVEVASKGEDGQVTTRDVAAGDFFVGPLESSLVPGDLVTAARFPAVPPSTGTEFVEVARRHGDYALCGVGAMVTVGGDGDITSARVAFISMAITPLVVDFTDALAGASAHAADYAAAGRKARDSVEPESDIHASAEYRRHLAGVLAARAVQRARS